MAHIINRDRCISCGTCEVECPFDAVRISDQGKFSIDKDACKDCGVCAKVCPVDAATADQA